MEDLEDGEIREVKGSGSSVYRLRNVGGVYSCTCPAWMHQSIAIERRTCKHIRALRGEEAEAARVGVAASAPRAARAPSVSSGGRGEAAGGAATTSEPPLLLAHKWGMDVDLVGWWMSEKLDGVRAYWDGARFVSRLGNTFVAPQWFADGLPDHPLDGELWGGRKRFQRTVGIVKRQDASDMWKEIQYVVFDAPSHGGPFEDRLRHCDDVLSRAGLAHVKVHEHVVCNGTDHLKTELERVEALGGEGLMLRKPRSHYEVGRSNTLLKVKTFHDTEARVIDYVAGAGRHAGRVGALLAELADGTRFSVGTGLSDAERANPPPIGALVTVRYQELSDAGVPRFPSYVGVRIDARWDGPVAAPQRAKPKSTAVATAPPPKPAAPKLEAAPAPLVPVAAPLTAAPGDAPRYFEFVGGGSNKFWEIRRRTATSFITRYGKIGSAGAQTLKEFASPDLAAREYDKLIGEKTSKGYREP